MPDVYNRTTDLHGGSFVADQARVTFPNVIDASGNQLGASFGLLVQRLNMGYQQQVSRFYEIGQPHVYYVGGRTAGDMGLDRIVGPRIITPAFYRTYGDVCRARQNNMSFSIAGGCNTGDPIGGVSFTTKFCVITTISLAVGAGDMIINEALRIMFSSLDYSQYNNNAAGILGGAGVGSL